MSGARLPAAVGKAVEALREKKAGDLVLLDVREAASFTDYFLICTSHSRPQSNALADEVETRLRALGLAAVGREGSESGEWVLLDYLDFIIHIFQERARGFYDLERLWHAARRVPLPEEIPVRARSAE